MDNLVVKAPVRVDFAGGPSDVAPFCVDEWGYVVNGAIDKYATVQVRRRADNRVVVRSADLQLEECYPERAALRFDTPLRLLTTAVELAGVAGGIEIAVRTDVPARAGLGASAAVSVALLYALRTLGGETGIDRDALARAAIGHETGTLQNTGGGQDQYAAAFGGFQGFHFAGECVRRNPLPVTEATRHALEEALLLCYSGTSRISGSVLGEIMNRYRDGDAAVIGHLRRLREIAQAVEALLLAGDLAGLGDYMTEAWYAFRALHPSVSTPILERIFAVARSHGASGGKATGAGGGGCVLLACDPMQRETVAAALGAEGFATIPFRFTQGGVAVVHE